MATPPLVAHTFTFLHTYVSQRDGSAPGSGVWSSPVTVYSVESTPSFGEANTFTAGALQLGDDYGIMCNTALGLAYLGNGLPAIPIVVSYTGSGALESLNYWNTCQGAWSYLGAKYASVENKVGGGWSINVISSTDAGNTWALQDGSNPNAPPTTSEANRIGAVQRVGNSLYFFLSSDGSLSNWSVYVFNFASAGGGSWQTPLAPLAAAFDEFQLNNDLSNGLYVFPNGDILILSAKSGTPKALIFTGSSWGSPITLPGASIANSVIDPSLGLIHILTYTTASTNSAVIYSTLAHNGTLTGSITSFPTSDFPSLDGVGKCSIQNGMIFVPRDSSNDNDNSVYVAALPVNPSLGFFKEELPIPPGEKNTIVTMTIASGGSGYVNGDTGTVNGGIYLATYSVTSVSGGGVITGLLLGDGGGGYSVGTNVATTRGGAQPGSGSGLTVNITSLGGNNPCCAYMIYSGVSTPGPLTLSCPSSTASLGVSYSSSFIVTGGTGPYTFAIISGSLPP